MVWIPKYTLLIMMKLKKIALEIRPKLIIAGAVHILDKLISNVLENR